MPDAQLPPLDPDEVEELEETSPSDRSADDDSPAVAGVGPALLAPPLPPPTPDPDDEENDES